MKSFRAPLLVVLACALLAGCGNKGDLVRPTPDPAASSGGASHDDARRA